MTSSDDSEDKVVVDAVDAHHAAAPRPCDLELRVDLPRPAIARGTRDHVRLGRGSEGAPRERVPDRDPVAVLRAWPCSLSPRPGPPPERAATPPPPRRVADDKIALAHLALELYREVEDVEAAAARVPAARAIAAPCTDQRCAARIDAIRGALVEACLLVQRAAMTSPASEEAGDIEDRIRELLDYIEG